MISVTGAKPAPEATFKYTEIQFPSWQCTIGVSDSFPLAFVITATCVVRYGPIYLIFPESPIDVDLPNLLAYVESLFPYHLPPRAMFTHESERGHDSHRHSTPDNFVLESLGDADRLESTYAPLTTSSSSRPSISLPAPDFSLPPTIEQNANNFSLPVRSRLEPQIENRRVSLAAFGDLSSPNSGAWYSQEGYQQAVAQFQARRSRSQPPRPGPETSYSQHQSFQAPVTMRYATFFSSSVFPTNKTMKVPSPQFYRLLQRISASQAISSLLQDTRLT
jgi:hypothetical protein